MDSVKRRTTLARSAFAEFEEKKSLFIGHAAPVTSEEAAREFINEKKREFHDATHNVFAYSLNGGATARYSDDGEPQGTAGVPVLNVIKMSPADDLCVVVTRYFGGTLLGAGGLVRAYSQAAKMAIDSAGIAVMCDWAVISVVCSYSDYQRLTSQLPKLGAVEDSAEFGENVEISVACVYDTSVSLISQISELTGGRASCSLVRIEERGV